MKKRQLAILGSTGSIGTQALEVVSEHSDLFEVYALTANNQVDLLINQARKYMPEVVVIANERKYPELKEALEGLFMDSGTALFPGWRHFLSSASS